jgi:hypothetical protein
VGLVTWAVAHAVQAALPDGISAAEAALAAGITEGLPSVSRLHLLVKLAAAGAAGGLTFLVGAALLRVREPMDMIAWALDKVAEKTGRRLAFLDRLLPRR